MRMTSPNGMRRSMAAGSRADAMPYVVCGSKKVVSSAQMTTSASLTQ